MSGDNGYKDNSVYWAKGTFLLNDLFLGMNFLCPVLKEYVPWNMCTEEKIEVAGMKKEQNALFEAGKYARASQREFNAPIAHSHPLPHCWDKEWELKVQHETILAVRVNQQGRVELFINWKNFLKGENP